MGKANFSQGRRPGAGGAQTKIAVVIGRKGGIGKTTTAANLAAALAMGGRRVLAVDADSQGHLALALGVDRLPLFSSWAAGGDLLSIDVAEGAPMHGAGFPAGRLALVSGGNDSLSLALDGAAVAALAGRLRNEAAALGAEWVIVDSPAVGPLQDFAILAADVAVAVAPCHFLGANGALDTIALALQLAPGLRVLGLPTMFDKRNNDSRHWLQVLAEQFADLLPAVPHRVAVAEAPSVGVPVVLYRPGDGAAAAYVAAADCLRAACSALPGGVAGDLSGEVV